VGIVSADSALHLPDFRAAERTFQLLSQVAGRAGRGELKGEIVVQTLAPEHPAILAAAAHDYEGFAMREDALRAELGYPPHGRLVRAVIEDSEEERVMTTAAALAVELRAALPAGPPLEVPTLLGPAPAPLARLRGRHRHHLLLKSPIGHPLLPALIEQLAAFAASHARPRVAIDVDPVSML
jgi:primosomal protein N' (replication factor Y) (superfamily II helicase)